MSYFKAVMHQIWFRLKDLTALPQTNSWILRVLFLWVRKDGKGEEKEKRKRKRKIGLKERGMKKGEKTVENRRKGKRKKRMKKGRKRKSAKEIEGKRKRKRKNPPIHNSGYATGGFAGMRSILRAARVNRARPTIRLVPARLARTLPVLHVAYKTTWLLILCHIVRVRKQCNISFL